MNQEDINTAIAAPNSDELVIDVGVDVKNELLIIKRANSIVFNVPFSWFQKTANGIEPDWNDVEIIDCGQTIRLGKYYEVSMHNVLYNFDEEFRVKADLNRNK